MNFGASVLCKFKQSDVLLVRLYGVISEVARPDNESGKLCEQLCIQ